MIIYKGIHAHDPDCVQTQQLCCTLPDSGKKAWQKRI